MPSIVFGFLAVLSLAHAPLEARPRYGGTLRVRMQAVPATIEPGGNNPIATLLSDRLIRLDEHGYLQPSLAVSWQADARFRRWTFRLRSGLRSHDGKALTSVPVAALLNKAADGWKASSLRGAVVIACEKACPQLAEDLAGDRYSIAGTGPFRVEEFVAGRSLRLAAFEEHWAGRPFLDAIEIEASNQALLNVELGRADVAEAGPVEARQAEQRGIRTWTSRPRQLIALAVPMENADVREALANSVDRVAIHAAIFQRQGEPAWSILPNWLTGYAFLFRLDGAGRPTPLKPPQSFALNYDGRDPLARAVAERVALDARAAGLTLRPVRHNGVTDGLRVIRYPIESVSAAQVLSRFANAMKLSVTGDLSDREAFHAFEARILAEHRIIPLVHLPDVLAVRDHVRVEGEPIASDGQWRFDNAWLDDAAPPAP